MAHLLRAVQVNWSPSWKHIIKLRRLRAAIYDTAHASPCLSAFLLIAGAERHMRTKGWDRLGYCSFLCLKNLVPFIVLMDSLNSRNESICLFLPQIYRHLFIYWGFLFRLGAADVQVICARQRFNSLCQLSNKRHREILLPARPFLRALQQKKSFIPHTQTPQLAHHYPSDSCLFVRMGAGGNMVLGIPAWHWILRDVEESCLHGYRSNKTHRKCHDPSAPQMEAQRCCTHIFAVCLDLALEDLSHYLTPTTRRSNKCGENLRVLFTLALTPRQQHKPKRLHLQLV